VGCIVLPSQEYGTYPTRNSNPCPQLPIQTKNSIILKRYSVEREVKKRALTNATTYEFCARQRVLNDLWRARFSRCRKIGSSHIPSHPSPGTFMQKAGPATYRNTEKERQLADADGRGGGRGWARSRIIRPQESLVLYNSFNILWLNPYVSRKYVFPNKTV
jgi:hypothetical protein